MLSGTPPELAAFDQTSDPVCPERVDPPYIRLSVDGGLRDVIVRLPDGAAVGEPENDIVTLDQRGCAYAPYVVGAVVGQTLRVLNSDATLHNVNARHGSQAIFNRPQLAGAPALTRSLDELGALDLRCDVHPWMLGHVLVGDHRYFAVSDQDGHFQIENVPAGTYTLQAWHPHLGEAAVAVRVVADRVAVVDFDFDPKRYRAP
jgi:plastocyanin